MLPQTKDEECQEYINNELLAISNQKKLIYYMSESEIKFIAETIKTESNNLIYNYTDEIPICEICLKRLELAIKLLRDEKNKKIDNTMKS